MQTESRRKVFDRELKAYQECMRTYIDDRKKAGAAEYAAANAAIESFNKTMKDLNAEQEKARGIESPKGME